jgi:hypothetical protein
LSLTFPQHLASLVVLDPPLSLLLLLALRLKLPDLPDLLDIVLLVENRLLVGLDAQDVGAEEAVASLAVEVLDLCLYMF